MARNVRRRRWLGFVVASALMASMATSAVPTQAQSRSLRWYPSLVPAGVTLSSVLGPIATPPLTGPNAAWMLNAKWIILAPPGTAVTDERRVHVLIGYTGDPGVLPDLLSAGRLLPLDKLEPGSVPPPGAVLPPGYVRPAVRTNEFALGSCGSAYAMGRTIDLVAAMPLMACSLDGKGRPQVSNFPNSLEVVFAGRYLVPSLRSVSINFDVAQGGFIQLSGASFEEGTDPNDLAPHDYLQTTIGPWPAWTKTQPAQFSSPGSSSIIVLLTPTIRYVLSGNVDLPTATNMISSLTELSTVEWRRKTGSDEPAIVTVPQPAEPPAPAVSIAPSSVAQQPTDSVAPAVPTSTMPANGGVCSFVDRAMAERALRQPTVRSVSQDVNGQPGCLVVGKNGVLLSISSTVFAGSRTTVIGALRKRLPYGVAWSDKGSKSYGYVQGNLAAGGDGQRIVTVTAFASPGGKSKRRRVSLDGDVAITIAANVLRQQRTGPVVDSSRLS